MAEYDEDAVTDLISRIQVFCYPRRIRVKEFFNDFDPLRHGRCTIINFARALDTLGMQGLTDEEVDNLAEHFTEHGAHVAPPQVVNYVKFCEAIDRVFIEGSPDEHLMSCSPSSTQLMSFKPSSLVEEEKFMHVLHRLASLCKARGVLFKQVFFDVDRSPVASPARQSPFMGGKVTREQFIRRFPFKKEFPPEDVELLAKNYMTNKGDVHFMAMHNDISEVTSHEPPDFPRSDLVMKPDESEWSQSRYTVVDKLRSKVVEGRIRIKQYFQDFDPLRKGYCAASQVKTVLTILNLSKIVTREDYDQLIQSYAREDGMFCYGDFCADVNKAFATPNLEKEDFQEETPKKLEPVLSPSNRSSRSSGLAPPLEKPKRLSERSLDVQKAGVQLELAQAMEDHDVETIRRMLPVASNLGVDQKEISAAKRILSFEVQQNLLEEVDAVRNMVSELAEAVAKVEERAAARNEAQNEANGAASVLQRIGPELERRVWLKLQPSIERLLQGFISKVKAPAKTGLEDFGFDDFDLNGDGYITREEFDQVRSRILKGEPLPTKAKPAVKPAQAVKLQEAVPLAPSAPASAPASAVKEQSQRSPADEALGRALRRSVYSRAASMQKAISLGSEHYTSVRWFVRDLFKRAAVRSAEMLAQSVEEKRQAACEDIASIRASKKRIEEAERKAEQQLNASTIKLQACARGKMARQQRQQLEDSTRILQRGFRRLRQRWQLGRKMDFAAVVRAVNGQRKDWAMEYHLACGSRDALGCEEFVAALQRVDVKISKTKVEKLWRGFVQQSEDPAMRLPTFWAICEAVAQGDARAAEFADMTLEEYLDGEDDGQHYSEEEVQAAQRIQAAQRGCQARQVYATQARRASEKAAAEKIQAALHGRMVREQQAAAARIQACYQGRMVREAARMPCHNQLYEVTQVPPTAESDLATQEAAAEKIQAIYRGRIVREQQARPRAAQELSKSASSNSAADFIQEVTQVPPTAESDLASQEAAAEKIQAIYRGRMVREQQARPRAAQELSKSASSNSAAEIFQEALVQQAQQGGQRQSLLLPAFSQAILKVAPATSMLQAKALFDGTCEGTGQDGISLKLFCDILQAVELGVDAASHFADLHVEDYEALAN